MHWSVGRVGGAVFFDLGGEIPCVVIAKQSECVGFLRTTTKKFGCCAVGFASRKEGQASVHSSELVRNDDQGPA